MKISMEPGYRNMIALGVDAIICDFPDRIGPLQRELTHLGENIGW
jgi:glycerophosphoryl diester phosphodiesterase